LFDHPGDPAWKTLNCLFCTYYRTFPGIGGSTAKNIFSFLGVTNAIKMPGNYTGLLSLTHIRILSNNPLYRERENMTENELSDLENKLKEVQEKWDANESKIKESKPRPYKPGKTGELIRLKEQQVELEQEIQVLRIRIRFLRENVQGGNIANSDLFFFYPFPSPQEEKPGN
jgi:hypothetical protein